MGGRVDAVKGYDQPRRSFAVALAALAGYVDAVGYISASGYFVSFMSGNTTRLGVALGTDPALAWPPALLIAGFVIGVTSGALIAHRARRFAKPAVAGLVTALLLCGAAARMAEAPVVMLAALVIAMGAINNTFQRGGEVAIGITYMTGALVRIGQSLAHHLSGQPDPSWRSWASLWGGLLAGALLGAALQDRLPMGCLWIASAWSAAMIVVALNLPAES
jgi:uncharacterized membrane protein YoaK (UPF0700 family)